MKWGSFEGEEEEAIRVEVGGRVRRRCERTVEPRPPVEPVMR